MDFLAQDNSEKEALSKRAIFRHIANLLGTSSENVRKRYYRISTGDKHPTPQSLLDDSVIMKRLCGPFNGIGNAKWEDVVNHFQESEDIKQSIDKVMSSGIDFFETLHETKPSSKDSNNLRHYLQTALYAVANNQRESALINIIKVMSLLGE